MKISILLKALISTCSGNEKFTCVKHKFTCEIYLWKICKAFYVVEKKKKFLSVLQNSTQDFFIFDLFSCDRFVGHFFFYP